MVAAAKIFDGPLHLRALPIPDPRRLDEVESIPGGDALGTWLRAQLVNRDRQLTRDDRQTIATLRDIWEQRRVQRTWADLHFGVDARLAQQILDDCAGDIVIGLVLEGQGDTLELFGRRIFLGRERLRFFQARLTNQSAIRAMLGAGRTPIVLRFDPDVNDIVESTYFDLPQLLAPMDDAELPPSAHDGPLNPEDYAHYRPGRWRILTTSPLRAPAELAPTDELSPSGWRLEVPDRIQAKLQQLDHDERAATLMLLWGAQQRGGREFLAHRAARVEGATPEYYVLSPTADLRLVLRPVAEKTLKVLEIVYDETLKMFRER